MKQPEGVFFENAESFESWLEKNGESADDIWIRIAKKSTGIASLDWKNSVDVALCFGWIDSKGKRIDDTWFLLRFTPRRPAGNWSRRNRDRAEALITCGRMRPAGMAEVNRAKKDGRWDAAYELDSDSKP